MSVMDKLINAMKFNDDDDFEEDEDLEEEEDFYGEDVPAKREERRASRSAPAPAEESAEEEDEDEEEEGEDEEDSVSRRSRKRFGFGGADRSESTDVSKQVKRQYSEAGMEVCIIKPTSVNDAREVTDTLLANSTVVLNLEGLEVDVAQRIIDFTSGSCYAVNGNVMKISSHIFVITPSNVDVSGDISTSTGLGKRDSSALNMPYGGRN